VHPGNRKKEDNCIFQNFKKFQILKNREGFCVVDVPPSPKFHDHDVGSPMDVSVK
jgi:hypothetical protein